MARKIVTAKSQIPKYAQKRIKGFKELTKNEAIFEYERYLLYRRARGEYKNIVKNLQRPKKVTRKDIAGLYQQRGKKLQEQRYETEPEPIQPLFVDLSTGEAIFEEDLPDHIQHCKELIDDLIRFTEEQANQSIVSYSTYRSGRTKSSSSRQWLENNINKAKNKVVSRLEAIQSDNSLMLTFAKKCANSDYIQALQNAIGDYIYAAYGDVDLESYYSSEVYNLLSFSPMTLNDSMYFEYEE